MRIFLLSFSAMVLFAFGVNAQQRTCASHDVLLQQLAENPLLRTQREAIERHTENYIHSTGAHDRVVVTIPVVVNVVYNTAAQNIIKAGTSTVGSKTSTTLSLRCEKRNRCGLGSVSLMPRMSKPANTANAAAMRKSPWNSS